MLELSRFSAEMLFPIALTMGTALMVEQIIQSKLKTVNSFRTRVFINIVLDSLLTYKAIFSYFES